MKNFAICVSLCMLVLVFELANAKPTLYKVNENDKLEPILIPVSSTVIPLPVYKVEFGISVGNNSGAKPPKPDKPIKLITASRKKATNEDTTIKQISKDDFAKQ